MKPTRNQLTGLLAAAVTLGTGMDTQADVIALIDLQKTGGNGTALDSTLADFTSSGVVEDISGGLIDHFGTATNTPFTGASGNVTISLDNGGGNSYAWGGSNGTIVNDGLYLNGKSAAIDGPSLVTVSNITIHPGVTYKLYIWGTSVSEGQEGKFTFNGSSLIANPPATGNTPLVFTFDSSTDGVTADSVTFEWSREGSQQYSVLNGIAITSVPVDTDADGLDDHWEDRHFGDGDGTATAEELALQDGSDDGYPEADGDGLDNAGEQAARTDPNVADTDNDGVDDGDELTGFLNPYRLGHIPGETPAGSPGEPTNPLDNDSDDDGILDGEEVLPGTDGFVTNPNDTDTDGDTLPDGWEVTYTLDPTDDGSTAVVNGASGDPDEDTLDNETERFAGTNPRNADTDDDGYDDNVEDSFGSWLNDNATGTNPLLSDTDGDGLLDGQENPDTGTASAAPYNSDPNLFDSDYDFYGDGDEVAAGTDPGSDLSVPTGIPMRNVGFTNNAGGWTATAGVALSTTEELLAGSGQYAVVDCNSAGRGVTVAHGNPAAIVYCSVDFRIDGAMGSTGEFNIMDGGATGARSQAGTNCILRVFGDASVQAYNGSTFLPVVPPGGIVAGTTYTAQIDHDVPNGLWAARVVDRQTGNVIGSITGVTVRPTSSPTADPLYFTVGSQSAQSAWDVAVDNMVVSLSAIDAGIMPPSATLTVTSFGFNAGAFELTVSGFDTAKQYILRRSTDLMIFTDVGTAFTPAGATDTVSDPSPTDPKAFYRIEEAP